METPKNTPFFFCSQKLKAVMAEIGVKTMLAGCVGTSLLFNTHTTQAFPDNLNVGSLNGVNGFAINGKLPSDLTGWVVSSIGDFNGDGIDDVTVGSPYSDFNGSQSGDVYVVFGSTNAFPAGLNASALNGLNGFTIHGKTAHDRAGFSVNGAGDVNGDGFNDLIIGAYNAYSGNVLYTGEAYVVFGSANPFPATFDLTTLNGNNGFMIPGPGANHYLGGTVSGAGDVNGDGMDDILVGSSGGPPSYGGVCYVIFGKNSFPSSFNVNNLNGANGFVISTMSPSFLGRSLSDAGDINGDGIDDVIIGTANNNVTPGECYVVFGNPNGFPASLDVGQLNGNNGFKIKSNEIGDVMGWSVSGAGDINQDGIDDIVVGAPAADPNGLSSAGKAYIIFGSANSFPSQLDVSVLNGNNGFAINGNTLNGQLGHAVSGGRDFNGDKIDDVIAGAPFSIFNGIKNGNSYVIFGTQIFPSSLDVTTLNGNNGFAINGKSIDDALGFSVSEAGDVNGDGLQDMMVASIFADPVAFNCGQAYVIFNHEQDPGDFDGDGHVDLVIRVQKKNLVFAALMTNGYYTGVKKDLLVVDENEQVVAINDFDLDGITDLATQSGTLVRLRKGPAYGVISSFNLLSSYNVIGSGNIRGKEVKGKKGYPELIIVKSLTPPIGKDYYYSLNKSNWIFNAPQFLYSHNGYNPIVGAGRFIDSTNQFNRYDEVMMYSIFANGTNKDLYARQVSFTPQDKTKFLMTMYKDEVLGAGNFKINTSMYEFIWSNSNKVYFSKSFSGYKLGSAEKVVGPK